MNIQIYEEFINTLPVACSLQRLIRDDNNDPIALAFIAVNENFINRFHTSKGYVLGKYIRHLNIVDDVTVDQLTEKSNRSLTTSAPFAMPIYHMPNNQWYEIHILPLEEDHLLLLYSKIFGQNFNLLQMETFLQANLDLMCVSSLDGKFLKVNEEFERVLGYNKDELEGRSYLPFIHPEDSKFSMDAIENSSKKGSVYQLINRYRCKNGTYAYIEWKVYPYGPYIYSSGRDITEAKRLQRELIAKNKQLAKLTQVLKESNTILFDKSITDTMTGLKNRGFFDEKIANEMLYAKSKSIPLCLLIYDIDYFKKVNDTYGHIVGDEVIKHHTELLKNLARSSDMGFRMGGEEFALLMPDTCINNAIRVAERIRNSFEETPHPIAGQVTASFGVAQMHQEESILEWYQRIDKALYKAKTLGRNRVVSAEEYSKRSQKIEIRWNEKWNSGNQDIDKDHKILLELILGLFQKSYEKDMFAELCTGITDLIEHIINHFDREEKILEDTAYPDLESHKILHAKLVNETLKLQEEFNKNELRPFVFLSFILDNVILDHMVVDDTKFFAYL